MGCGSGVAAAAAAALKGLLETRLVFVRRLYDDELRRAIWDGCCWCGCFGGEAESRFAMRSGEMTGVVDDEAIGGDEFQPKPDSRRMCDLTGSVPLLEVTRRSRRGVSGRGRAVIVDNRIAVWENM